MYGIGHDDVAARGLSQQLQNRASLDVLEVQRQALAFVFPGLREQAGTALLYVDRRVDLDRELVVGLVGELLVLAVGRNNDACIEVRAKRVDRRDRRREIHDVEPAHQLRRQARILEHRYNPATFLANVDRCRRVGQVDDDATAAITCAAEVNAGNRTAARRTGVGALL